MRHSLNKGGERQTGIFWNQGEDGLYNSHRDTSSEAPRARTEEAVDTNLGSSDLNMKAKWNGQGSLGLGSCSHHASFLKRQNVVWAEIVSEDLRPVSCILYPQDVPMSSSHSLPKWNRNAWEEAALASPPEKTYHNGNPLVNHGGGGIQAGRVFPNIQGGPRRQAETHIPVI